MNDFYKKLVCCVLGIWATCSLAFADYKMESLIAFARTYGIVRYYSPNPYTQDWTESDWFQLAYAFMLDYRASGYDRQTLEEFLSVFSGNATLTATPDPDIQYSSSTPYYYREYHGSGKMPVQISEQEIYNPFYVELKPVEAGLDHVPDMNRKYSYPLTEGLYLNIPIAEHQEVFNKEAVETQRNRASEVWKKALDRESDIRMKIIGMFRDEEYRITDMIVRWNIIQHFYPYHQEDNLNWKDYLNVMIQLAIDFYDEEKDMELCYRYYDLIREAMNPIRDSHLIVNGSISMGADLPGLYLSRYFSPLELKICSDGFLVKSIDPEVPTIIPMGSELLAIDGKEVESVIQKNLSFINSSNFYSAREDALRNAMSAPGALSTISVTARTPLGNIVNDSLSISRTRPYREPMDATIYQIEDGIAYFNPSLSQMCYNAFKEVLERKDEYSSIIFDLRNYPAYDFIDVLGHLTNLDLTMSNMLMPIFYLPDQCNVYYSSDTECIRSKDEKLDKRIIFLSDYTSMSYAETILMLASEYKIGVIIGSPSRGTNGDVTRFDLPVFGFTMTALKAVNVDGTQHHGIGVCPDFCVDPISIEQARNGHDPILEKAKAYIKEDASK